MNNEIKANKRQIELLAELKKMTPAEILALPTSEEAALLDKNFQKMREVLRQTCQKRDAKRPKYTASSFRYGRRSLRHSKLAIRINPHIQGQASTETYDLTTRMQLPCKQLKSIKDQWYLSLSQTPICISHINTRDEVWITHQGLHDQCDTRNKTAA